MADERSRLEITQALSEKLGPDVTAALMECVPPFGWHEIATKSDQRNGLNGLEERVLDKFGASEAKLGALETKMDAGFAVVGSHLEALEGRLTGLIHEKLSGQNRALLLAVAAALVVSLITNLLR